MKNICHKDKSSVEDVFRMVEKRWQKKSGKDLTFSTILLIQVLHPGLSSIKL